MKNKKTTLAAALGAIAITTGQLQFAFDGNAATSPDILTIVGAIAFFVMGLFARDQGANGQ